MNRLVGTALLVALLWLPGCGQYGAIAGTALGTYAGALAVNKVGNKVADSLIPLRAEEDRRDLSAQYVRNLELQNQLLEEELRSRRGGTDDDYDHATRRSSRSNCRRNADNTGYDCY